MGKFKMGAVDVCLYALLVTFVLLTGTGALFLLNKVGAFLITHLNFNFLCLLWSICGVIIFVIFFAKSEPSEVECLKNEIKLLKEAIETYSREMRKNNRESHDEIKKLKSDGRATHSKLEELRSFTGIDVKKLEDDAEKAILNSVQ